MMENDLPDPSTAPELFEGLLTRRMMAYVVDLIVISVLVSVLLLITGVLGVLTLGLAWLSLPIVAPIAVLFYYAVTLGSPNRATIGMRLFDLVLTPTRGQPVDGWRVLIHPLVFWITIWIFWPLLFIGLFSKRRQLLHDMLTSTLMVRRSPMARHWGNVEAEMGNSQPY